MKSEKSAQQLLTDLCSRDQRYPFEAYDFVISALGYVQDEVARQRVPKTESDEESKHVTGQQLSEGCRDFALQEFGLMAGAVLRNWNIHKTDDIGELVYNLIDIGLFSKQETDSKEDFNGVYDMKTALSKGFSFNLCG
jgi:uncharacterized repeat protein (TIGR04138 family)